MTQLKLTEIVDIYKKRILILGCGNILFGDDGFGPRVIEYIEENVTLSDEIGVLDVGTGVRDVLFDIILLQRRPKRIIIIDAVDMGRVPGEIFEVMVETLPANKIDDFSLHQVPTSNLLKELKELSQVDIKILVCQIERIPQEVEMELSESVVASIPKMCQRILEEIK